MDFDIAVGAARYGQGHGNVSDCERMQNELAASVAVLARPVSIPVVEAITVCKM